MTSGANCVPNARLFPAVGAGGTLFDGCLVSVVGGEDEPPGKCHPPPPIPTPGT